MLLHKSKWNSKSWCSVVNLDSIVLGCSYYGCCCYFCRRLVGWLVAKFTEQKPAVVDIGNGGKGGVSLNFFERGKDFVKRAQMGDNSTSNVLDRAKSISIIETG